MPEHGMTFLAPQYYLRCLMYFYGLQVLKWNFAGKSYLGSDDQQANA